MLWFFNAKSVSFRSIYANPEMVHRMTFYSLDVSLYPQLDELLRKQLELTPRHAGFFEKRFSTCSAEHLATANLLSGQILSLASGETLSQMLSDYDWLCDMMIDEEAHFRRSGKYRLETFEDAVREVYSDDVFMGRYINGLLLTQVWWANHTDVFCFFLSGFLNKNKPGYKHLEIGPGHGLFLYQAAADTACQYVEAWDVAAQSIASTRQALTELNTRRMPELKIQDLFEAEEFKSCFDSIVFSEVLEHLDRPSDALSKLRDLLTDDGRMFINMPVNSPAPDHLFLLSRPEEVIDFVTDHGLKVEDFRFEPQTNSTLEKARKWDLTISCAIIVTR